MVYIKGKDMKEKSKITPFSLRLELDLKNWLKHKAIDNRRSLNSEIEHRLIQSQQQEEKEAA